MDHGGYHGIGARRGGALGRCGWWDSGGRILEYTDADADGQYEPAGQQLFSHLRPNRKFEVTYPRSSARILPGQEPRWRHVLDPTEFERSIPDCRADFNGDGRVDSGDFFDYLRAFMPGEFSADFDYNGAVNTSDFFEYLTAFFGGC